MSCGLMSSVMKKMKFGLLAFPAAGCSDKDPAPMTRGGNIEQSTSKARNEDLLFINFSELLTEFLHLIRAGRGVGRVFGADVNLAVVERLHFQRNDGGAALVDGLGVLEKIALLDAFARERRHVGIEEGRAPPFAVVRLEWRAVAKKPTDKFARTVGASDLIRSAIVEIVGAFACVIGGPRGADKDVFVADFDDRRAFMTND